MRTKRIDNKDALSLLEEANNQMIFTIKMPISVESSFNIVRNVYECFRMLGDALLISKGLESTDHIEPIKAIIEIKDINTKRSLNVLDNMRIMRHNINYNGYSPTIKETEDVIDFAKLCFNETYLYLKKKVEK